MHCWSPRKAFNVFLRVQSGTIWSPAPLSGIHRPKCLIGSRFYIPGCICAYRLFGAHALLQFAKNNLMYFFTQSSKHVQSEARLHIPLHIHGPGFCICVCTNSTRVQSGTRLHISMYIEGSRFHKCIFTESGARTRFLSQSTSVGHQITGSRFRRNTFI